MLGPVLLGTSSHRHFSIIMPSFEEASWHAIGEVLPFVKQLGSPLHKSLICMLICWVAPDFLNAQDGLQGPDHVSAENNILVGKTLAIWVIHICNRKTRFTSNSKQKQPGQDSSKSIQDGSRPKADPTYTGNSSQTSVAWLIDRISLSNAGSWWEFTWIYAARSLQLVTVVEPASGPCRSESWASWLHPLQYAKSLRLRHSSACSQHVLSMDLSDKHLGPVKS